MKKLIYSFFSLILWVNASAQNKSYYVSPAGNDENDGLSPSAPWQSINKVNLQSFQPGDKILFEGGAFYSGNLVFKHEDKGTPENPVIVNVYGRGKAVIRASNEGFGIYIYNCGGIEINNLVVEGNGATNNTHTGVKVFMDDTQTGNLSHIYLDSLEVKGFGDRGITITTWDYPAEQTIVGGNVATKRSFHDIRITHSEVHDNGYAGIYSEGDWPNANHTGLYIGYCSVYNNRGIPTLTETNSGSGIMISGFNGGLIEYSEAYNNGEWGQGSIGMWVFDAKNITIQYCESYNNKTAAAMDGGGFDIDGGAQNCIIQYCYSHNNEGAGFALFEYGSPTPFTNNVIRYNISQNDGRKNGYGGLAFWSGNEAYKIIDCEVYNNTVYMSREGIVNGTPAAIKFSNNYMQGLKIRNNSFYVTDDLYLLHSQAQFDPSMIHFQSNNYYSATGRQYFVFGGLYTSLSSWMAAAPGQELSGGKAVGFFEDPLFTDPGGGGIIHPSTGADLTSLAAYRLRKGSPLINAGMNLKATGIDIGPFDFYNTSLADEVFFDIGAHEYDIDQYTVLPLRFTFFEASIAGDGLTASWATSGSMDVSEFYVETSRDGRSFASIGSYAIAQVAEFLRFDKKVSGQFSENIFCRIKAVTSTGQVFYSETKRLTKQNVVAAARLFPNPATGTVQIKLNNEQDYKALIITNNLGQWIRHQNTLAQTPLVTINIQDLKQGVYYIELVKSDGSKEVLPFLKK